MMLITQKPSVNFRKLLAGASAGEVLIPIMRAALYDPDFKSFDVHIDGFTARPPDPWFHPSTHPMMHPRQLYYYLAHPDALLPEIFDPHSTMAVTQGTFWHEFFQHILLEVGAILPNPTPTPGRNVAEWGWVHAVTQARGHSDGLTPDQEIFELKSMNQARLSKLAPGAPADPAVLASFRKMCPDYYAQGQEYMRLSGRRSWRCVLMAIEYPYPMREIVMAYDPIYAQGIAFKYETVIQAVADQRPPRPCCGGGAAASTCFARAICPLGSL